MTISAPIFDVSRLPKLANVPSIGRQPMPDAQKGPLEAQLAQRSSRLVSARNHVKCYLFATSDGKRIVLEGSLNLRTCNCYEQFTLCDDADLYNHRRAFLEGL